MSLITLFTNPIYQVSVLSAMLMCMITSVVGVFVLIKKRSLIGEVLSHCTYPGIAVSVLIFFAILGRENLLSYLVILFMGFIFCFIGYFFVHYLEKKTNLSSDTALCLTLASFLGIGVLLTSTMQISHPVWVGKIQMFLYGQIATMTSMHLHIYTILSLLVLVVTLLSYSRWKIYLFDESFSKMIGLNNQIQEAVIAGLIVLSIVVGIRAAGVIMISGMLVAPALAARQFTNKLSVMLILAGFFGLISGVIGSFLSLSLPSMLGIDQFGNLPTGPVIIIVASLICFLSLLFAPKQGQLFRYVRKWHFQHQCLKENLLKFIWKKPHHCANVKEIKDWRVNPLFRFFILFSFKKRGLLSYQKGTYQLTVEGIKKAKQIVRLHRLWEVYLFKYLGYSDKRVHSSAEEMEHILTPELELKLVELLDDPKKDPHNQPIPEVHL